MREKTFVFNREKGRQLNTDSHITYVSEEDLFHAARGYGFLTEDIIAVDEAMQIPELNGGFQRKENTGYDLTTVIQDEYGCGVEFGSNVPLCFKIDVLRLGNYEVSVTVAGEGECFIFTGARRLAGKLNLVEWDEQCCTFSTNVCDMIPRGSSCLFEHRSLNIVVIGKKVRLQKITYKNVNCPTVYLAGDSSVMDRTAYYPYEPAESFGGWGQMLPCFFMKGVSVSNHSQPGLQIDSFRSEGHFAMIKAHLKLGDYLFLHFSKDSEESNAETYRRGLIEYIEETRAMGAYPVIVTPFCRNTWHAETRKYHDKQNAFAQICKEVGKTYRVPVIDLHKLSKDFITRSGENQVKAFFVRGDSTNLNDYGAYKMAQLVHDAYADLMHHVRADGYAKLSGYLIQETTDWIPENTNLKIYV